MVDKDPELQAKEQNAREILSVLELISSIEWTGDPDQQSFFFQKQVTIFFNKAEKFFLSVQGSKNNHNDSCQFRISVTIHEKHALLEVGELLEMVLIEDEIAFRSMNFYPDLQEHSTTLQDSNLAVHPDFRNFGISRALLIGSESIKKIIWKSIKNDFQSTKLKSIISDASDDDWTSRRIADGTIPGYEKIENTLGLPTMDKMFKKIIR